MTAVQQQTGMRGVYLVAAEMAARGLVVSPTSRSALGADLLVTDASCNRAFSVQVKTNGTSRTFWLLNRRAKELKARSHVYVFVNILTNKRTPEYFVVPSKVVAQRMRMIRRPNSTWYFLTQMDALRYRDKWQLLGAKHIRPT